MENEITSENSGSLAITIESAGYLNSTRKWTTFFSVLGFIFIGLFVCMSLFLMFAFSSVYRGMMPFPVQLIGMVYLLIAVIYFFPVYYLLKFSNHMNKALKQNDSGSLDLSLKNLKSHYKFMGIFTIVGLSIYILSILFIIIISFSR